jgi:glucosamine--fructose-6-phosphate aminotransferase (isomerizing)
MATKGVGKQESPHQAPADGGSAVLRPGQYLYEIREAPDVLRRVGAHLRAPGSLQLRQAADLLRPHASGRLVAVGVAGSLHAAQALEAWCGRYGIPVIATSAARLYTGGPALAEGDRILLISQSGETPELLEWIDPVRARHQELVVLVNDENSTLASAADLVLPMEAGPELGPASKTFMSSLLWMDQLCEVLHSGTTAPERMEESAIALERLMVTGLPPAMAHVWRGTTWHVGEGAALAAANQAAWLMTQTTSVGAASLNLGQLRYGAIGALDSRSLVLMYPDLEPSDMMFEVAREVRERGAHVRRVSGGREGLVFSHPLSLATVVTQAFLMNMVTEAWNRAEGKRLPVH